MIVLVVLGLSPYVYCQDTARGGSEGVGVLSSSAGNLGSSSGDAGEEQSKSTRDPFWPVGYTPSQPGSGAASQTSVGQGTADADSQSELDMSGLSLEEQAIIKSHVRVGGILVQRNECLAIINSQLVRQGDDLSVLTSLKVYTFMIRSLTPDSIVLESVNEQVREEGKNP